MQESKLLFTSHRLFTILSIFFIILFAICLFLLLFLSLTTWHISIFIAAFIGLVICFTLYLLVDYKIILNSNQVIVQHGNGIFKKVITIDLQTIEIINIYLKLDYAGSNSRVTPASIMTLKFIQKIGEFNIVEGRNIGDKEMYLLVTTIKKSFPSITVRDTYKDSPSDLKPQYTLPKT